MAFLNNNKTIKAMNTTITKNLIALFGAVVPLVSFTSCTDRNDVEISYDQTIGVTAAHIFDNYEPIHEGDFDMSKDGWKLHLQVLVYNEQGELVDRTEKTCSNLNETIEYVPSMNPGEYTVVSIADFREGPGGVDYQYWYTTNESNLQDLSITETDSYLPTPFETLGIDIQKISVTDAPRMLNVDIKPATSLVQVFTSDKDYSGWGMDGYSRFSVLAEGYFLRAIKCQNNVRFENGEIACKYTEQTSDYNVAISHTYEKWSERQDPTGESYRALLPEKDKGFKFHIQERDLPDDYYESAIKFCGGLKVDGVSNVLPEMASNKQYVLNMILDAMQLVFIEMPSNYTRETYTQQFVNENLKNWFEQMANTKYENILGKDESFATTFLGTKPYGHDKTTNLYLSYYNRPGALEQSVTCGFLDPDYTKCGIVFFILPTLTDEQFINLDSLLSDRFQVEEYGKFGPDIYTYLEPGKSPDDSRYRVVLQKIYDSTFSKYIYELSYVLRTQK